MVKHTLIIVMITAVSMVVVAPLQTTSGSLLSQAELAKINSVDTPAAGNNEQPQGKGNGFVQALKAPFKAIGRLFGGGKKDPNKLQRISEKDAKKFQSVPATRVKDATTVVKDSTAGNSAESSEPIALDHLEKGRALLTSGDLNAAIAELSLAASLDPKSGEAHTVLGVAYDRKGLRDRAQQSFEAALHASGDEAMHLNNLGYFHYKNGDYDEAIEYLKRSVKIKSEDARIWNNLGMAQCGAGKFDDAYKSFVHATDEFQARLKVASYLERQGFAEKAIKQLEKARKLRRDSLELWSRLAVLYDSVGRGDDANEARASVSALKTVAATAPKE
jgi:Flp pilus assembly protein TadD